MIKLINLSNNLETIVKPTIFPDGTSQVWKLPQDVLIRSSKFKIVWYFESEAEVIQLLQLRTLLVTVGEITELYIPYFPYARQDKKVSNEATFAQTTILDLLDLYFSGRIKSFDLHNPSSNKIITNTEPTKYIVKALVDSQADLICYPDAGAATRYPALADFIVAEKTRDQLTGQITGHNLLESKHSLEGKTVLIVDDIGDGMATFISVSKMLYQQNVKEIYVYISHGIFSKGVVLPTELGKIKHYYTTNSYLPSQQMLQQHSNVTIYQLDE